MSVVWISAHYNSNRWVQNTAHNLALSSCVCVCVYIYISGACYNHTPHLIHCIQSCKYPAEFLKLKTGYIVFDQAGCLNLASLYNFITLYPNTCKYVHALVKSQLSTDCMSYFKHHTILLLTFFPHSLFPPPLTSSTHPPNCIKSIFGDNPSIKRHVIQFLLWENFPLFILWFLGLGDWSASSWIIKQ